MRATNMITGYEMNTEPKNWADPTCLDCGGVGEKEIGNAHLTRWCYCAIIGLIKQKEKADKFELRDWSKK